MTTMMMIAPANAVRLVSSSSAAPVSSTPMRMRNHTGKCQTRNARAQPLVSENLEEPCLMKTHARNSANTHNTTSSTIWRRLAIGLSLRLTQVEPFLTETFTGQTMDEEKFNLDVRKFLKHFGVTAQREIEKAVAAGIAEGKLEGTETIKARAVLELDGFGTLEKIEGEIHLA